MLQKYRCVEMVAERRRNSSTRFALYNLQFYTRTGHDVSVDPIIVVDPILGKTEEKLSLFRSHETVFKFNLL